MQAAVTRGTQFGAIIGAAEALTPEAALELFLGDPLRPGAGRNRIEVGKQADLCLVDRPWSELRMNLAAGRIRATLCNGQLQEVS
jgi:predicted amidohydrolase YtcJ